MPLHCLLICYLILIFPLDVFIYFLKLFGALLSFPYFFHLLHFICTLPFNPNISPSLLHIISCLSPACLLQSWFSLPFKMLFECYLKISKDSDSGGIRTHVVLPPYPFFAVLKKKNTGRHQSVSQLRGPITPVTALFCLL